MRASLIPLLRCPSCGAEGAWSLEERESDDREIREGQLGCARCGVARQVRDGIIDLLDEPPEFVVREAAGLERFADLMRSDGWDRERVLQLPYVDLGYWYAQADSMRQVLDGRANGLRLRAGQRILDVGSNTCWASAMFAERGLEVVALDIAAHEMQGLRTADWWFDAKDIYFERVLSVMFEPALASNSFDLIWCCEVLHHNHRANLRRTMRELHRLLKPGGTLIVVNEPVRALGSPKLNPGSEVAEFEGHEHAYVRGSYVRAARAAGFEVTVYPPMRMWPFGQDALAISERMGALDGFKLALWHACRRERHLRSAYIAWRTYVDGESLHMLARKPAD